jgi:hypothetical protein
VWFVAVDAFSYGQPFVMQHPESEISGCTLGCGLGTSIIDSFDTFRENHRKQAFFVIAVVMV